MRASHSAAYAIPSADPSSAASPFIPGPVRRDEAGSFLGRLPEPPSPRESTRPEMRGLRVVVERAGLSWEGARKHLDSEGWRPELERNRKLLLEQGLWGVPSFRLVGEDGEPDYCTWGQDRIWRVEEEIRRRRGTPGS